MNRDMKKYIAIIFALLPVLLSCNKEWTWSGDLGVNSTRINISSQIEGAFTLTVFSNTTWEVLVTQGADWLKTEESSGEGIDTIHLTYSANLEDPARIAKVVLTASTGKTVTVNVIQSGNTETASSISDYML